jgi:hypothetical protein
LLYGLDASKVMGGLVGDSAEFRGAALGLADVAWGCIACDSAFGSFCSFRCFCHDYFFFLGFGAPRLNVRLVFAASLLAFAMRSFLLNSFFFASPSLLNNGGAPRLVVVFAMATFSLPSSCSSYGERVVRLGLESLALGTKEAALEYR